MTRSETGLRVLLANEREDDLRKLGEVLDGLGHEVVPFAVSVREAVELIAREDPDVAFVVFDGDDAHGLALLSETVEYASGPVLVSVRAAESPQTVARRVLDPQTPILESQRAYLLGLGVKTVLLVPLSSGGQVNGRLSFRFAEEREFQPEELEIARALAIQASLAIQLTRLANAAR